MLSSLTFPSNTLVGTLLSLFQGKSAAVVIGLLECVRMTGLLN